MKTLKGFDFRNKRVLVRCDFNVPLDEKGLISDDFRIKKTIPTIEYLIKKGAKVILMSHLDDPGGKVVESLRLTPIQEKLMEYLDLSVVKAQDCIGKEIEKWIHQMQPGEILLLENLRFHKGEEEADENFAKELSKLGDIYINDAFGVCHRNHASIVGIPKYLPSGAGLLLEKEIKILSQVLKKPLRPLIVVIGGVKISSKIKVIEKFLEKADHLLFGGEIANAILATKGILPNQSLPELEVIKKIEKIDFASPKLHFPVDAIISLENIEVGLRKNYIREGALGQIRKEEKVYDVGPETIKIFSEIIKEAKMILWNGPLGMIEEEKFQKGSEEIAKVITKGKAFSVVGGGETVEFINKMGFTEKINHLSTGGGAMLAFLSGEKLPGIEALNLWK